MDGASSRVRAEVEAGACARGPRRAAAGGDGVGARGRPRRARRPARRPQRRARRARGRPGRARRAAQPAGRGRDEGGLLDRVAELDRRAAGLADELELQRRAREQAEAAAAADRATAEESGRVVADLDAAASALRERVTNGTTAAEARRRGRRRRGRGGGRRGRGCDTGRRPAPRSSLPPPRRPRSARSSPLPPARRARHATGRSQRQYPWLRGALVKLAHDDPRRPGS